MGGCPHNNKIGDNYGLTCSDCGEPLAGYGYFAEGSRACIHQYVPITNELHSDLVCLYCEGIQSIVFVDPAPLIRDGVTPSAESIAESQQSRRMMERKFLRGGVE